MIRHTYPATSQDRMNYLLGLDAADQQISIALRFPESRHPVPARPVGGQVERNGGRRFPLRETCQMAVRGPQLRRYRTVAERGIDEECCGDRLRAIFVRVRVASVQRQPSGDGCLSCRRFETNGEAVTGLPHVARLG